MSWAKIIYAINSKVGKTGFKPIDLMIESLADIRISANVNGDILFNDTTEHTILPNTETNLLHFTTPMDGTATLIFDIKGDPYESSGNDFLQYYIDNVLTTINIGSITNSYSSKTLQIKIPKESDIRIAFSNYVENNNFLIKNLTIRADKTPVDKSALHLL